MRCGRLVIYMVILFVFVIAACEETNEGVGKIGKQFPKPTDTSQIPAGELAPGTIVLPNGRLLTPAGNQLKNLGNFPMNMLPTPDNKFMVILCNGYSDNQLLISVKIPELTVVSRQSRTNPESFFYGLKVFNAPPPFDASYKYLVLAAGGHHTAKETDPDTGEEVWVKSKIYVYGMDADGNLGVPSDPLPSYIELDRGMFVGAMEIDSLRGILYVAYVNNDEVTAISTVDFSHMATVKVTKYPYDLQLSADLNTLYVTNWGTRQLTDPPQVSVIDTSQVTDGVLTVKREITVGKNPEGMALSHDGRWLFVANSETDDISVIDTRTNFVSRTISLRDELGDPYGVKPTDVSISPDGSRLLVASSGRNAMEVIDANTFERLGSIPSGWWPTAVREVDNFWYILNGKGEGSGPNNENFIGIKDLIIGSLSQVPVTTDEVELETYTAQVRANNLRQFEFYSRQDAEMIKNLPIKHVVYILKENKTYDQVLGDFEGTESDPSLCVYCCDLALDNYCYTPNMHKLAEEFVNLDNFYSDAECSMDGHMWNASANVTDYVYKMWMPNYRNGNDAWFLPGGVEPASFSMAGFIFGFLTQAGVPFHDYGEIVGSFDLVNGKNWDGVVLDPRWPLTFDLSIPDVDKVEVFLDDLKAGDFPSFVFMLLPNDHTSGCSKGAWHPDSLVADNDAALGKVVEAISNSPYWGETIIFVTEDDPQSGYDHVDAHRTLGLVISPWVKRGTTISTHYSWPNFYKTFEVILGLPPMSLYDFNATPMYDIFTDKPDFTPYTMEPQQVPMVKVEDQYPDMHQCSFKLTKKSNKANFTIPDQVPYLGEILWELHYPNKPFPEYLYGNNDEEDGGQESEEVKQYQKLVEMYKRMYLNKR